MIRTKISLRTLSRNSHCSPWNISTWPLDPHTLAATDCTFSLKISHQSCGLCMWWAGNQGVGPNPTNHLYLILIINKTGLINGLRNLWNLQYHIVQYPFLYEKKERIIEFLSMSDPS